ncbi:MAG: outer membrane protein Omp28 [Flavipsychrobacter sp.]|jgi:hypothetical protein|nr:outer membrane protein Omp28 [Flavipsychrobacter sp.]
MKKIYLLLGAAGIISLNACTEKGPAIDFGTTPVAKDTTYMAKVELADKKVVLIEELTGASCVPCVPAREQLAAIAAQHPDQLAVMEMHIFSHNLSEPVHGYNKYDLRTEDATEIQKEYYADFIGIPTAGIDRVPVNNVNALTSPSWAGAIDKQLQKTPPVNVKIKSNFDESARNAVITVTVSYTQAVAKKQFLSVAILEKDIVDAQKTPTGTEKEYTFKHTFRDMVTGLKGDEFLKDQPTKDAGRVYERTIIYPVDANWKPEKCMVVAYVHDGDGADKEVLQAAETELNGQ